MVPLHGKNARVLIVDCHADVRHAIYNWLTLKFPSLVVVQAGNTREALEAVRLVRFDIVLMDMALSGGTNGLIATRQIIERAPAIKIIIISEHNIASSQSDAIAAGAIALIPKVRVYEYLEPIFFQLLAAQAAPVNARDIPRAEDDRH